MNFLSPKWGQILKKKGHQKFFIISIFLLISSVISGIMLLGQSIPFFVKIPLILIPLVAVILLIYYMGIRWNFIQREDTRFHADLILLMGCILIGASVSVWFLWDTEFIVHAMNLAFNQLPPRLVSGKTFDTYIPYASFVFFIGMTTILALVVFLVVLGIRQLGHKKMDFSRKFNRSVILIAYFVFLVSTSTAVFSTDALQQPPGQQSVIFWGGTEDYINHPIRDDEVTFEQHLREYGGFTYGLNPDTREVQIYRSSTGFYTLVLKLIQTSFKIPPETMLVALRILFSFFLAVLISTVSIQLLRAFGIISSIAFSFFPLITYWIIGPAHHLIWVYFLLPLPLFLSAMLYRWVLNERLSFEKFVLIIFISQFLIFLRAYTYAPNLIVSPIIPILFFHLQKSSNQEKVKKWQTLITHSALIFLAGLTAMGFVGGIHFLQLSLHEGSWQSAIAYLSNRASYRGPSELGVYSSISSLIRTWLFDVNFFYVSNKIHLQIPNLKKFIDAVNSIAGLQGLALVSSISIVLLTVLNHKHRIKSSVLAYQLTNNLGPFAITTMFAMITSWGWFPAIGHMAHHLHMNGIMFVIPFGFTLFAFLGTFLQWLLDWLFAPPLIHDDTKPEGLTN